MTLRQELNERIKYYESLNNILGDAMAIACRSTLITMTEAQLAQEYSEDDE